MEIEKEKIDELKIKYQDSDIVEEISADEIENQKVEIEPESVPENVQKEDEKHPVGIIEKIKGIFSKEKTEGNDSDEVENSIEEVEEKAPDQEADYTYTIENGEEEATKVAEEPAKYGEIEKCA